MADKNSATDTVAGVLAWIVWVLLALTMAAFLILAPPLAAAALLQDVPEVPSAPQNLTARPADGRVTLVWEAPADDGGVEILGYDYSYHAVGDEENARTGFSASLRVTVFGLVNSTQYKFMVRAANAAGGGAWASVTAAPADKPSAPQNLTATPADGQVTLAWAAPADDGGGAITGYTYSYHIPGIGGGDTRTVGATTLTVTVGGLPNGTEYNFLVWAVNAAGDGPWAILRATPATVPGVPQNLTAVPFNSILVLSWDPPASNGGTTITDNQVRYAAGSSVPDDTAWESTGTGQFQAFGLTNGTEYAFEVRAVNPIGGGVAATITATPAGRPGAPRDLMATPGDGRVTLTWLAPADDGGSAITDYQYRYADRSVPADTAWTSAGTDPTVMVNGLANGTRHFFQVRAENGVGASFIWANSSAVPDVDPVVTVHPQQAEYSFVEGASDAGVTIVARTEPGVRRPDKAFPVSVVTLQLPDGATSGTDYGPLSVTIAVEASDFGAAGSAWEATKTVALTILEDDESEADEAFGVLLQHAPSTPAWVHLREADGITACVANDCRMTVTIMANGVPSAPQHLSAAPGDGRVTLSWQAPASDGGAASDGYEYRYAEGLSVPAETAWASAGTDLAVTVSGLANGREHAFAVRAVNDAGEGPAATATAMPQAAATVPGMPRNLLAAPGDGQVTLTWRAPASDGGAAITGYEYRYAEGLSVPADTAWASAGTDLRVTVSGLANGREHAFAVRAANRVGEGPAARTTAVVLLLPMLSVADAEAREGIDTTIDFAVVLNRRSRVTVAVDYATADGSAKAGEDYGRTSGRLTFLAGETEKTVFVPLLDDAKDEREETFTLALSHASRARIARARATGTIMNDGDAMPGAWLVRFGRTVADQVVDAVSARLDDAPSPHATVGGVAVVAGPVMAGMPATLTARPPGEPLRPPRPLGEGSREPSPTLRDVMRGSAFHLSAGDGAGGPAVSAWGRVAAGGFEATVDDTRMDGTVATGSVGADADWGDVLAGAAVAYSEGHGSFAFAGDTASARARGTVESTLTGIYPYLRLRPNRRISLWGLAGVGAGDLTLTEDGGAPIRTRTALLLAAIGAQGTLVPAPEAGGVALTLKADGFWVQTSSDAVRSAATGNLEASEGEASRVRLALQGERVFALGEGRTLAKRVEAGVRHDGGDAETGAGFELGAGVRYRAPGVSVDGAVRTLVAHENRGHEEWGASGAIRVDPGVSGRGLSLELVQTWGAPSRGAGRLWSASDARAFAAADGAGGGSRMDAELGYGLNGPRGSGAVTPYAGLSLTEHGGRSMRLGTRWTVASALTLGLEGSRGEGTGAAPEHALILRAAARW